MYYKLYRFLSRITTFFIRSPKIGGTSGPTVWFHLASLGEISAARGLLELFLDSGYFIFTTVFTSSALDKMKDLYKGVRNFEVVKFPYDKPSFIEGVFKSKRIRALIIVETEFWPNLVKISGLHTKVYLINGRISDKNYKRLLKAKGFIKELLENFSIIFPNSTRMLKRFEEFSNDKKKLRYLGNTKIDTLFIDKAMLLERKDLGIPEEDFVVTFGSVRGKELALVTNVIRELYESNIGIIVAPRHPARVKDLEELLTKYGIPYTKRTRNKYKKGKVFIVDTLGELKKFFYLSNICFVGGTLADYGGHNILEPAVFGKPVLFGPFVKNIEDDARGLIKYKGGVMVQNIEELKNVLFDFYGDKRKLAYYGENALRYVENLKKVSSHIYKYITDDLYEKSGTLF